MTGFVRLYGARPAHLIGLLLSFALIGYVIHLIGPEALWNQDFWWRSIIVWFLGAVVLHDLILFPLYALADRVVTGLPRNRMSVSPVNYIRVPALGAGLTFIMFFPGIISQGAENYVAATGLTQEPFLGRWLALTAALFTSSALAYAVRATLLRSRA